MPCVSWWTVAGSLREVGSRAVPTPGAAAPTRGPGEERTTVCVAGAHAWEARPVQRGPGETDGVERRMCW